MLWVNLLLGFFLGLALGQLLLYSAKAGKKILFADFSILSQEGQERFNVYLSIVLGVILGAIFVLNYYWLAAVWWDLVFWQLLSLLLVAVAVYDLAFRLVPALLMGLLVAVCLLASLFFSLPLVLGESLLGAAVVGALVLALYLITRGKGIGEADLLLALVLGLLFGWLKGLVVFAAANFLGLVFVLPLIAILGKKRMKQVPLVFFLVVVIFLEWYMEYSGLVLEMLGI